MTGREGEDIFHKAIGAHMSEHNEAPYVILINRVLASALVSPDGTHRQPIPTFFEKEGVSAFAQETYHNFPVNVELNDDVAVLTLTELEWKTRAG